MTVELFFESKLSFQLLRQVGAIEEAPVILLHLALMSGPKIYASDQLYINDATWSMRIRRESGSGFAVMHHVGRISFFNTVGEPSCAVDLPKSPERYEALLDMFKNGYVSEITMLVDGLIDNADYSKSWDTDAGTYLNIKTICFEFPLPQSEG